MAVSRVNTVNNVEHFRRDGAVDWQSYERHMWIVNARGWDVKLVLALWEYQYYNRARQIGPLSLDEAFAVEKSIIEMESE